MKKCQMCGTQIDDNATYCPICGAKLETVVEAEPVESPAPAELDDPKKLKLVKIAFILAIVSMVFKLGLISLTFNLRDIYQAIYSTNEGYNLFNYAYNIVIQSISLIIAVVALCLNKMRIKQRPYKTFSIITLILSIVSIYLSVEIIINAVINLIKLL